MSKQRRKRILVINVRRLILLAVTVLLCVLAVLSCIQLVKRFMKVGRFEVVGISRYENEELISASGVKRGDALYLLDEDKIVSRMLEECPYLESVELKAKFPNRLRITVVGKDPQWYLEVGDTKYALDSNLVVIAETVNTEGMTGLVLPKLKSAMYGEVPQFGDSQTEVKHTLEIVESIRRTSFKDRLTRVDLESRWDISLEVDGVYRVIMGDLTDFEAKLKAVEAILDSERVKGSVGGELDVSVPANPGFRPIYEETEREDTT